MNDYDFLANEQKNQTLVLVEGEYEKQTLLSILLNCFPEIPISSENIHVYASDIYDLYHDIEKEYEEDWYENELEVDIPMLISRRHAIEPPLNKKNFTNIILMFDYEHHDIWFTDEKIQRMQKHFNSISDDGILYINYPMIEAYKDIVSIPDEDYMERFVSVTCQPGKEYKRTVEERSFVSKYFNTYDRLLKYLGEQITGIDQSGILKLAYDILSIREKENLKVHISNLLIGYELEEKTRINMEYSIANALDRLMYLDEGISYWEKLRQIIIYIVDINIEKGVKIQTKFEDSTDSLKDKYLNLDWTSVLEEQNKVSGNNEMGIIWVLCTCVTILAEYKFYWNAIQSI